MASTRAVRRPSKRAVAERLASLQTRRAGMVRHIKVLEAFPPAQLMPYERGQLRHFRGQVAAIDQLIAELTGG